MEKIGCKIVRLGILDGYTWRGNIGQKLLIWGMPLQEDFCLKANWMAKQEHRFKQIAAADFELESSAAAVVASTRI